jgi:hypothetical protein
MEGLVEAIVASIICPLQRPRLLFQGIFIPVPAILLEPGLHRPGGRAAGCRSQPPGIAPATTADYEAATPARGRLPRDRTRPSRPLPDRDLDLRLCQNDRSPGRNAASFSSSSNSRIWSRRRWRSHSWPSARPPLSALVTPLSPVHSRRTADQQTERNRKVLRPEQQSRWPQLYSRRTGSRGYSLARSIVTAASTPARLSPNSVSPSPDVPEGINRSLFWTHPAAHTQRSECASCSQTSLGWRHLKVVHGAERC